MSCRASDNPQSSLPSDVSVSSARPDIVMREGNVIKISELTVCSERVLMRRDQEK